MREFYVTGLQFDVVDDIDNGPDVPALFIGEWAVELTELRHALAGSKDGVLTDGAAIPVYKLVQVGTTDKLFGPDKAE